MLEKLSSRQVTELLAFYRIEPLPNQKIVDLLATLCSLFAASRGSKLSLEDLLPDYWEQVCLSPTPDLPSKLHQAMSQFVRKPNGDSRPKPRSRKSDIPAIRNHQ